MHHTSRDNSADGNVTESQKDVVREYIRSEKPFDFSNIKIILKKGKSDTTEQSILLPREWAFDNIPHFRGVISSVKDNEGIEITLSCNPDAFHFSVEYLKLKSEEEKNQLIS